MMILALLAAVFGGPADGQTYVECIQTVSIALEASGDSAADVAKATVLACVPLETKPTADSPMGQMKPNDQVALIKLIRSSFEERMVLRVVRLRACRKTPGCNMKTLPNPY